MRRGTCKSSRHKRLSNGIDSLNFSMSGSTSPVKRPPQSFLLSAAMWVPRRAMGLHTAAFNLRGNAVRTADSCKRHSWVCSGAMPY